MSIRFFLRNRGAEPTRPSATGLYIYADSDFSVVESDYRVHGFYQ